MQGKNKYDLVVIGGSAGSLAMALKIVSRLKGPVSVPVLLVFHRKSADDSVLLNVLQSRTDYTVKEIDDKDGIMEKVLYVAPPDYHVLVEKDGTLTLDDSEKVNFSRPSIDVAFESAVDIFGSSLMCVLLSGANSDGAQGMAIAARAGATLVVQDPRSAEVPCMPTEALARITPDLILSNESLEKFVALCLAKE